VYAIANTVRLHVWVRWLFDDLRLQVMREALILARVNENTT
jgi:hypothetical protein